MNGRDCALAALSPAREPAALYVNADVQDILACNWRVLGELKTRETVFPYHPMRLATRVYAPDSETHALPPDMSGQNVLRSMISRAQIDCGFVESSPLDALLPSLPPVFHLKMDLSSASMLGGSEGAREKGVLSSCRLLDTARVAGVSPCIGTAGTFPKFLADTHGPLSD
ncbi:hypothetical protein FB451DRAFT_1409459 [Mycena latifolia]|nr:hypothetical protein FB451DRAFT_1409459 [Mycena latifolia]